MDRSKRIIGVVLICVSIVALFSWEKWGRNRFIYDDIIVLEQNVDKGTVITADMVTTTKIEKRNKGTILPSEKSMVVGKEANQFIRCGEPLFKEYFKEKGLVAGASLDKYILKVSEGWIESCPESLSKGDLAYFYTDGQFITSAAVSAVNSEENDFEIVATGQQAAAISKLAAAGRKFVISYN